MAASAYFSHLSSPEREDAAVETIISQAADLCALEQIAALNTSHLSEDSLLPTNLEARFRKLKSFPGADPPPRTPPRHLDTDKENIPTSSHDANPDQPIKPEVSTPIEAKTTSPLRKPDSVKDSEPKLRSGFSSPLRKPDSMKDSEPQLRSGFSSSPSISLGSPRDSPSPPRQVCCFGCSPKKVQRKKSKVDGILGSRFDVGDWERNHDILSDMKDQQRKLKKALKEQERVSREAEKVVEWVKQASARMNVAAIDELLGEDEEFK